MLALRKHAVNALIHCGRAGFATRDWSYNPGGKLFMLARREHGTRFTYESYVAQVAAACLSRRRRGYLTACVPITASAARGMTFPVTRTHSPSRVFNGCRFLHASGH